MALQIGIIGLPNVGKSTLFNALTSANIEASNFPFCTIEPNTGVVPVPDNRLSTLADLVLPKNTVPATVEFVDIAGLVKGASKGEGLGNAFLANIRETRALVHVVRCFANNEITHVHGKVDPIEDVQTINTELALADLQTLEKQLSKRQRLASSGDSEAKTQAALIEQMMATLNAGNMLHNFVETNNHTLDLGQKQFIQSLFLLTTKPILYIANVDETSIPSGNMYSESLTKFATGQHAGCITMSNAIESEIAELDPQSRFDFIAELKLGEPGLHKLIRAGYTLLGLQTFFTAGKKEVRAWTCRKGDTAPEAAGVIHSDFFRGFIRAEVIAYEDFVHYQGEQNAKEAGKKRIEGKDYRVKDGDIMHFRYNT